MSLSLDSARTRVFLEIRASLGTFCIETVGLGQASGRVLAEDALADRDYPPFARSARDGFAVRSADVPGTLKVAGESRAGSSFAGEVQAGEAVEIMTGAPVPAGADTVVMVEHTHREGDAVVIERAAPAGANFNRPGIEARMGEAVVQMGTRLDFAHIAMLAACGKSQIPVVVKPRVAILGTGDEIVAIDATPGPYQIRNSNSAALAVQVERAGGIPLVLPVTPDEPAATKRLLEQGLAADLLLVTGGVSAGKYDIVENVLAELGARMFFDRVAVQPGQPLVFGECRGKFFFGLPGNPSSAMVTFELFGRAAIDLLSGAQPNLALPMCRLTEPYRQRTGLTRVLPARVSGSNVTPEPWQGSGDIPALARANAFLVSEPDRETWEAGDLMRVMMR